MSGEGKRKRWRGQRTEERRTHWHVDQAEVARRQGEKEEAGGGGGQQRRRMELGRLVDTERGRDLGGPQHIIACEGAGRNDVKSTMQQMWLNQLREMGCAAEK